VAYLGFRVIALVPIIAVFLIGASLTVRVWPPVVEPTEAVKLRIPLS
jgi:hypothetical protein